SGSQVLAHSVRHLCIFLILCFHLVYAGVPGPCKHSVTQDHLLNLRRLIKNQLQNGCSITYTFTERQNLSVVCYVKAAFPHILELLNTQFRYAKDSDNYRYTNSLKNLIYNIYSQRCIPPINEEIEVTKSIFILFEISEIPHTNVCDK
uniref:Colony stimulating factor 1b (macrophage) n=1 Tax=Sinocyclocheilus anshuiensis TaxID=1608454 RepID=A0A671NTY6_9TELE